MDFFILEGADCWYLIGKMPGTGYMYERFNAVNRIWYVLDMLYYYEEVPIIRKDGKHMHYKIVGRNPHNYKIVLK